VATHIPDFKAGLVFQRDSDAHHRRWLAS
jgi:hypothetical protein